MTDPLIHLCFDLPAWLVYGFEAAAIAYLPPQMLAAWRAWRGA